MRSDEQTGATSDGPISSAISPVVDITSAERRQQGTIIMKNQIVVIFLLNLNWNIEFVLVSPNIEHDIIRRIGIIIWYFTHRTR